MQYRHLHKSINTAMMQLHVGPTSCKNLVNFSHHIIIISSFTMEVVIRNFYIIVSFSAVNLEITFLSGTSAVNAAHLCTAGINQHCG